MLIEETNEPTQTSRTRWRWKDSACLLTLWLVALLWVGWVTQGGRGLPYDAFRDTAWSKNMLEGNSWADPSILGASWWYAPVGPGLMAAAAAISGQEIPDVHAGSALWLNPLIIVTFFLLVRRTSGTWTALASVPLLLFGSLWWLTHLGAAMPSIQGTVSAIVTILLWTWCVGNQAFPDASPRQLAIRGGITGSALALTAWWHPVCALVAAGTLGMDALILGATRKVTWPQVSTALGSAAASSMILAAPLMIHLAGLPRVNPVPLRYIAPEMANPDFALYLSTPGVGILAIIGLALVFRNRFSPGWPVGLLAAALIGQAPAYLPWWQESNLPILVPHEFQWHGQLAIAALAAIGLGGAVDFVTLHLPRSMNPRLGRILAGIVILAGILAPAALHLQYGRVYLADLDEIVRVRQETVAWINSSTSIDAVIACSAPEAYLSVAGLTGRKCAALPAGHTNPSVDAFQRLGFLESLFVTVEESEFLHIARQLGITHVLVTLDSTEAIERLRRFQRWPCLIQVFSSEKERNLIYEITPDPVKACALKGQ